MFVTRRFDIGFLFWRDGFMSCDFFDHGYICATSGAQSQQIVLNFPPVIGYDGLSHLLGRSTASLRKLRLAVLWLEPGFNA